MVQSSNLTLSNQDPKPIPSGSFRRRAENTRSMFDSRAEERRTSPEAPSKSSLKLPCGVVQRSAWLRDLGLKEAWSTIRESSLSGHVTLDQEDLRSQSKDRPSLRLSAPTMETVLVTFRTYLPPMGNTPSISALLTRISPEVHSR